MSIMIYSYLFIYVFIFRKERRVFETYKMEALAARSKKDKDDIENFRKEVRSVCACLLDVMHPCIRLGENKHMPMFQQQQQKKTQQTPNRRKSDLGRLFIRKH